MRGESTHELSTLIQYVAITYIVGHVCFILFTPSEVDKPVVWGGYQVLFYRWVAAVAVLAGVRLIIFRLLPKKNKIKSEWTVALQYLVIALVAGLLAFWVSIPATDGAVNIAEEWRNDEPVLRSWIIGFTLLSGIRLVLIYTAGILKRRLS